VILAAAAGWVWRQSPRDPLHAAVVAYDRGEWDAAYDRARERLKQVPSDPEALRLLARASVRLGRDSSGLSLYDQFDPATMKADDFYLVGVALARSGNVKGSMSAWELGLKNDPDHPELLYEMAKLHLLSDRFHEATEAVGRLASHPDWRARALALEGKIAMGRSEPSRAADLLRQALDLKAAEPGDAARPLVTPKELARALLRARRPVEARAVLQPLLEREADAETSWLLSRAHLQDGKLPEALAALHQAGSYSDDNPTVRDPAPFVGAASCAPCHAEKYQSQQSSRHARTYRKIDQVRGLSTPPASFPDPADPKVTHTLKKTDNGLSQETRTTERLYRAVADYAFGSGDRGETFVGHDPSGQMYELRLSVYRRDTEEPAWDVTSGHMPHPARDQDFLGMAQTEDAVRRCFSCHVTNPQSHLETRSPESADHAIGCEKCHGPGGNHLLAIDAKFPDVAITRPGLASGAEVVAICAQCHSPRGKTVDPNDPTSVRFQGTTLTWSRCYTESRDRLDCVTCHDPHRNVATSTAHYESKCLMCHTDKQAPGSSAAKGRSRRYDLTDVPRTTPCPINPTTGCISCHMPQVEGVIAHSPFTDHFIRVHRETPATANR
jgi:tetratricopeptide (TPR) repeat protein